MKQKKIITLNVDAAKKNGIAKHVAAGSLYGVVEEFPPDEWIRQFRPINIGNSPEAGHQQPLGAAIPTARRIAPVGGKVQIRLAEWFTGWYNYAGLEDWFAKLETIVSRVKESGITNVDGYELWNEPDGTWKGLYVVPVNDQDTYYVTFRVQVPQDGEYQATVRYANGTQKDAALHLRVNGEDVDTLHFPSTGGWYHNGAAGEISFRVRLHKGENKVKLYRASVENVELDYLDVQGAVPVRYEADTAIRGNTYSSTSGYASSDASGHLTFNEFFSISQKKLQELDPAAKTIGPSSYVYSTLALRNFLQYQKDHGTLPDIICWHQLADEDFTKNYKDYRELEKELDIGPLPISINEYSGGGWFEEEGKPGVCAPLIAKFERFGVDSACQSFWNGVQGTLSSTLTPNYKPNGGFWFYKWYADMDGEMVMTVPERPNDPRYLDGFACLDAQQRALTILFGGEGGDAARVDVHNLPASFGDAVTVTLGHTAFQDRFTEVSGPETVWEKTYPVKDGTIEIEVTELNCSDGYRLFITPEKP